MIKVERKKELHHCSILNYDVVWVDYVRSYGEAIDVCFESVSGMLIVTIDKYSSRVNYCPFCGYKAKEQMVLKK